MKEAEIVARMVQNLPKCGKCRELLSCVRAERPKNVECDLTKYEDDPRSAFNGCSVRCTLRCRACGSDELPDRPLLHYGVLYNHMVDTFNEFKSGMTLPCGVCQQKCFPGHLFHCTICADTEAACAMCGRCAITGHAGVGHNLVAVDDAEALAFKRVLQQRSEQFEMTLLKMTIEKMDGAITKEHKDTVVEHSSDSPTPNEIENDTLEDDLE